MLFRKTKTMQVYVNPNQLKQLVNGQDQKITAMPEKDQLSVQQINVKIEVVKNLTHTISGRPEYKILLSDIV